MATVDEFFAGKARPGSPFMLALGRWLLLRGFRRRSPEDSLSLVSVPGPIPGGPRVLTAGQGAPVNRGLVVGTVRMGYGHHRLAAAACSWALERGVETHLHDLITIDAPESERIARLDRFYSRMSRFASEIGGPVEWLWGRSMSRGDLNSLRLSCLVAEELQGLMGDIDRQLPLVGTFPLNGQLAVASGFKRVVNMIVDNYPQYFLLVPGAINLVQGPAYYTRLREMGVPARSLEVAGHWVHRDIVANLPADSQARLQRLRDRRPRRLLLPIGGAGAQRRYLGQLILELADLVRRGSLRLYLNTGDHPAVFEDLVELLRSAGLEHQVVSSIPALSEFCAGRGLAGDEPDDESPVTVFHFAHHFEAYTATDRLVRVVDLMATKPSELAFIPVPKLHIRRVGDHEAASAVRSQELGDGIFECRETSQAAQMLSLLCEEDDLLLRMNENILRNHEQRLYCGAKVAVELALSLP